MASNKTTLCRVDPGALREFAARAGARVSSSSLGCFSLDGVDLVERGRIGKRQYVRLCAKGECKTLRVATPRRRGKRGGGHLGQFIGPNGKTLVGILGEGLMVLGVMLLARVVWIAVRGEE